MQQLLYIYAILRVNSLPEAVLSTYIMNNVVSVAGYILLQYPTFSVSSTHLPVIFTEYSLQLPILGIDPDGIS